ncbi:helix-turn-helix transcriptional regulator [Streptomyces sp. NPDC059835]|uniref:helix-turn-helix transcriptional regulator n=1 Tax=Streptomyces sp. NPDC059835 TaxID=3346967 RepID=UPI0036592561
MSRTDLTPQQVQAEYGITVSTLANHRWRGTGPVFKKVQGNGRVLYERTHIEEWLNVKVVTPGGAR